MELWLHGARDPQVGAPLAQRYAGIRSQLAAGLDAWADEAGHPLPTSSDELASAVLALLIGAAVQDRLDPPAVPPLAVVNAARRLVGLPDQPALPSSRTTQKGNLP